MSASANNTPPSFKVCFQVLKSVLFNKLNSSLIAVVETDEESAHRSVGAKRRLCRRSSSRCYFKASEEEFVGETSLKLHSFTAVNKRNCTCPLRYIIMSIEMSFKGQHVPLFLCQTISVHKVVDHLSLKQQTLKLLKPSTPSPLPTLIPTSHPRLTIEY